MVFGGAYNGRIIKAWPTKEEGVKALIRCGRDEVSGDLQVSHREDPAILEGCSVRSTDGRIWVLTKGRAAA